MSQHPPDTPHHFWFKKLHWRARQAGTLRLLHLARRRVIRPAWFAGMVLSFVGCIVPVSNPPTATPLPTPTTIPTRNNDGWQQLQPGLEQRTYFPPDGFFTRLAAVRIDPTLFDFRVHYRPGDPLFIDGWRTELPEAAVIFNTNFFDRADRVTGMIFADGVQYGDPYRRRGGTFYINDGVPGIQSNLVQSYAGEQYDQAVQAFPMLVTNGAQSYFDNRSDRTSRRTVVALDAEGRVIVLVTSFGGITLLDLAEYLPTTDMQIVDALNLDGGGSSMLDVQAGGTESRFTSFDPVPAVMGVYPR